MAMTAQVKDELASTAGHQDLLPQGRGRPRCCASPAACTSSAAGSWSRPSSTPAPPRAGCAATSPRSTATQSDVVMVSGNGIRKGSRYIVRVVKDGEALARQTGLLDGRGRPVRGLPPQVVSGGGCDAGRGLARRVPGARLADRARPLVRARDHLPRARRRRWRWSARPAGSASRPRPARCAASTGS